MELEEAKKLVERYLTETDAEANEFGSMLPSYEEQNSKSAILTDKIEEHEFGWVFYYNSQEYLETGDFRYALGGNAPIIVNRRNGELVVTGTAHPVSYYVAN